MNEPNAPGGPLAGELLVEQNPPDDSPPQDHAPELPDESVDDTFEDRLRREVSRYYRFLYEEMLHRESPGGPPVAPEEPGPDEEPPAASDEPQTPGSS